jgi:pimeloyl-ACP methyl ester carboxylesterase
MRRLSIAWLAALLFAQGAAAADLAVLVLHGKGGLPSGHIRALVSALEGKGYLVAAPVMPWAQDRIYDASFEESMKAIDREVEALKQKGAKGVVVAGHSLGANAALGYAAYKPGAAAIIALAPGHTPELPGFANRVASEVARAKSLIAAGKGNEKQRFADVNQGRPMMVSATPQAYLSWFDPDGPAVMPKSAAEFKVPTPLLVVVGTFERNGRGADYFFDKAPPNPKSRFITVSADHFDVPTVAIEAVVGWLATLEAAP